MAGGRTGAVRACVCVLRGAPAAPEWFRIQRCWVSEVRTVSALLLHYHQRLSLLPTPAPHPQKHEKARRELAGGEVEDIDENFIRLYWEQMLQASRGLVVVGIGRAGGTAHSTKCCIRHCCSLRQPGRRYSASPGSSSGAAATASPVAAGGLPAAPAALLVAVAAAGSSCAAAPHPHL